MAKLLVGLFDRFPEAQSVVQDLLNNGFPRDDISLAASDARGEYAEYTRSKSNHMTLVHSSSKL
jgi:hypothetical protein